METKHTPGPWKTGREHGGYTVINSGEWAELAKVVTRLVEDREVAHDGIANARLIAAAPEMYEAIAAIATAMNLGYIPNEILSEGSPILEGLRAAIAKAEGK